MASLTTSSGIRFYLEKTGQAGESIQELTNGTANYVWRITSPNGRTSIVKHAEPYVKSNKSISFPISRLEFEAKAMSTIHQQLVDNVKPPSVFHYDDKEHVIIMSDGGSENLKDRYSQLPRQDVESIASSLGTWLAKLHNLTRDNDLGTGDNSVGRAIYRYAYAGLQGALASHGLGGDQGELGKVVNEKYGSLLATDDECLCHGDFWPGNIIVGNEMVHDGNPDEFKLTVVDWEMSRWGVAATDVAQFVAEAYLLDRFRGGGGLALHFLNSYLNVGQLAERFWERLLVHFGVHACFWPTRVSWGSEDEVKQVAVFGVQCINESLQGNATRFSEQFKRELKESFVS